MNKIVSKVIKKVSNKEISIKKNYKLFRVLEKIAHSSFFDSNAYENIIFDCGDRNVKARVFKSFNNSKDLKAIVFIHGGGWVLGSVESYTKTCIELAKKTKRMVIAVDYRLAPEYPYPHGFNDCYDVIKVIMSNLDSIGLKEEDICLMGDSAGGNLVAAISIKAKVTKDFKVRQQILLYPALQNDYSENTKYKSVIENGKDYFLTRKQLEDYVGLYVKDKKDLNSPYVAPLKAKFLFNQPRTLVITADKDPLRDEGIKYAKKLKFYLNNVVHYNFKEAIHGFLTNPVGKKYKAKVYEKIIEFLGDING